MIKGKFNLAAFKHVFMKKKNKEGKEITGIFIPLEANSLFHSEKGGVYFDMVAFQMKQAKDYATHIIKQSFNKETREKMSDEEKQNQPIFGNLQVNDGQPQAENNNAGGSQVYDSEANDDLPF